MRLTSLRWRQNDNDGVSNHQPQHCLLKSLFRRRSKETSKLRVTGLCAGNSPGTGEFPAQMACYAEDISIWWRHHEFCYWLHRVVFVQFPTQSMPIKNTLPLTTSGVMAMTISSNFAFCYLICNPFYPFYERYFSNIFVPDVLILTIILDYYTKYRYTRCWNICIAMVTICNWYDVVAGS